MCNVMETIRCRKLMLGRDIGYLFIYSYSSTKNKKREKKMLYSWILRNSN